MRVAVMARSVRPGATGVGRYAANLIDALARVMSEPELTVFVTRDAPRAWHRPVREVRAPFTTPNEVARALWEQTVVPAQTAALGIDVYHSPNYILPAAIRCPSIVTFHDLAYLNRRLHRLRSHLYLRVLSALAVRKARTVVAVSHHTRRALERRYPRLVDRVEVIYEGVDPALRQPTSAELETFRERRHLERRYVLFVGTSEPRKNLPRLVRAFERVVDRARLPHELVLVGPRGWGNQSIDDAIANSPVRERIRRVGFVPDEELRCWYSAADLFVYPSLEEGFGLPPLEAMALGTPTITSNNSALPEVVGDAAVTISPTDETALAAAIEDVLTDKALATWLRQAGPRRAAQFSWSDTAERYAKLYRRTAAGGPA